MGLHLPPQIDHSRGTFHHNNDYLREQANARPASDNFYRESSSHAPPVIDPRTGLLEPAGSNRRTRSRVIDINEAVGVSRVSQSQSRPLPPLGLPFDCRSATLNIFDLLDVSPTDGPRIIEIEDDAPGLTENGSTRSDSRARTTNVQPADSTQRSSPNQQPQATNQTEPEPIFVHPVTIPSTITSHPEFQPRPPHLNPHYVPEPNPKPRQPEFNFTGPILSFEHGPRIIDFPNLKESRTSQLRSRLYQHRLCPNLPRSRLCQQPAGQNQQRSRPNQQRGGINQQRPQQNQQRVNQNQQRSRPNQQPAGLNHQRSRPGQQRGGINQQRSQPNQQRAGQNQQRSRQNQQPTGPNQQRSQSNQQPLGPNQQRSRPILSYEHGPRIVDFSNVKKRNKANKYINPLEAIDASFLTSFFLKLPLSACMDSTLKVLDLFLSNQNEEFTKFMQHVIKDRDKPTEPSEQERSHILDLPLQPARRVHVHENVRSERLIALQDAINQLPIERPFLDLRLVLQRFSELRRIENLNARNRQQFSRILDFTDDSNVTIERTNYFRRFDTGTHMSQNLFQPWMMVLPTQLRQDVHRAQEVNPNRPMIFDMSSEPFYMLYNQRLMDNIIANPTLLLSVLQEIQNRARRMEFGHRRRY